VSLSRDYVAASRSGVPGDLLPQPVAERADFLPLSAGGEHTKHQEYRVGMSGPNGCTRCPAIRSPATSDRRPTMGAAKAADAASAPHAVADAARDVARQATLDAERKRPDPATGYGKYVAGLSRAWSRPVGRGVR
jgi:hypothetical protein